MYETSLKEDDLLAEDVTLFGTFKRCGKVKAWRWQKIYHQRHYCERIQESKRKVKAFILLCTRVTVAH